MPPSCTITEQDARHVAKLARLQLSDEQITKFSNQLCSVIDYIEKINELNLDDVEPLAHVSGQKNVLREDVETPGLDGDIALSQAPEKDAPFFKVPKVLGESCS